MKQVLDIENEDLTDEQKEKLKIFNENNSTILSKWREQHGSKPPPLYWDSAVSAWHWVGRDLRRAKRSKRMTQRRRSVYGG